MSDEAVTLDRTAPPAGFDEVVKPEKRDRSKAPAGFSKVVAAPTADRSKPPAGFDSVVAAPPTPQAQKETPQFTISQGTPWEHMTAGFWGTDAGRATRTASEVWHGFWNLTKNPLGMTDEAWDKGKKEIDQFSDKVAPHIVNAMVTSSPELPVQGNFTKEKALEPANKAVSGAISGTVEFGGEMLSAQQLALMAGTFGESTLVRGAAKLGIEGAIPAARTVAKLAQLKFTTDMIEGSATGAENTFKAVTSGDWKAAGQSAVSALISGVMAKGLVNHEMAQMRVQGDLNRTAQATYQTSFDKLDPHRQGLVIDRTVKGSEEYKAVLRSAEEKGEQTETEVKHQQQEKLAHYYGSAVENAHHPDAAQRTIRNLEKGRYRLAGMERKAALDQAVEAHQQAYEKARQQSLRDVVNAIKQKHQARVKEVEAQRKESRKAVAGERVSKGKAAQEIQDSREELYEQRQQANEQTDANVAQRQIESAVDPGNPKNVEFPVNYLGEDNRFGVSSVKNGQAIYRKVGERIEWLDSNGIFQEDTDSRYVAPNPETAATLARLSSAEASADSLARETGATIEQKRDAMQLEATRRKLVTGEITAKEAQRQARISERVTLPDEFSDAKRGKLAGPLYGKSAKQLIDDLETILREPVEGEEPRSEEDIQAVLDENKLLVNAETEKNLHHVFKSGDYIVSKRGVRWVLDAKGMLQPDNGGQPIPLMKNGFYSKQAMQLAESGRVGYGRSSYEDVQALRRKNDVELEGQTPREATQERLQELAKQAGHENVEDYLKSRRLENEAYRLGYGNAADMEQAAYQMGFGNAEDFLRFKQSQRIPEDEPRQLTYQKEQAAEVKDRAEGKVQDPEPQTPEEAQTQLDGAAGRTDAATSVALDDLLKAVEPPPEATEEDINKAVEKAESSRRVAEQAVAQEAKAKSKMVGPGEYPQKASITSRGFTGSSWAVGSSGVVHTNAGDIPVHLELVKPAQLTISFKWNGNELERTAAYPEQMQDVPPDEATRMQLLNDAQPQNYGVRRYLDPGYGPEHGPAIIDTGGDVVGGNRRLLRMAKHLELIQNDPIAMGNFRNQMREFAAANGMIYPAGDDIYIPVRMMESPIGTLARASELGDLFNKGASTKIDAAAKAITHGRMLYEAQLAEEKAGNIGVLEKIAEAFNRAKTPREAMADDPTFFAEVARKYLNITDAEKADWFNKNKQGEEVLKVEGKEKLEMALLSTVLKNPSTLEALKGSQAYQSLLKSIGPMTRLRTTGAKDITGVIEEAVETAAATERKRIDQDSPRMRWNKVFVETNFFDPDTQLPEPNRVVESIWRAMHDDKSTRLKNALNDYLIGENRQTNAFETDVENKLPSELFNAAFEPELKEVNDARGLRTEGAEGLKEEKMREYLKTRPWEVTPEEFEAARDGKEFVQADGRTNPPAAAVEPKVPAEASQTVERQAEPAKKSKFGLVPPPRVDTEKAATERLAAQKQEQGYVTPAQLSEFLKSHPGTKNEASELMRTATLMAEYVYDADPPVGVDKKDALDWVLRERLAKAEIGTDKAHRGEYSDPNIEIGFGTRIMKLNEAATPDTFIHEFAHVIFPLLRDEDLKAIDTIGGHRLWEGRPTGNRYAEISEKLAHGLEQFLRDENPTGFTAEVKQVLAKVKAIMRKVYLSFASDPLSKFKNTEESRAVFSKMFGITGFDKADDFLKDVRKAKADEKRIKKPSEEPHPLVALGKEMGASGLAESLAGKIEDSVGERVDPRKGIAVLKFNEPIDAVAAFQKVGTKGSKIQDAELIRGDDGTWGIRFNTDKKLPPDILHQDLPRLPEPVGRSYDDVQKDIDALTDEYEKRGEDPRYFEDDENSFLLSKEGKEYARSQGTPEYKPMPEDLRKLYQERDDIGAGQLKQSIGEITDRLKRSGISDDKEITRVLDKYAINPSDTGAAGQYRATEYTQHQAQRPLEQQLYDAYFALSDARGIDNRAIDEQKDILRYGDPQTLRDAAKAVKAVVGYFRGDAIPGLKQLGESSTLYQDLPETEKGRLGLELEDLEKRLRETKSYMFAQKQLLELKIKNQRNKIRAAYGAEALDQKSDPELAEQALEEAKNGRETAYGVRKDSHGVSGIQKPQGTGRISKPSFLGMSGHAGSAERGGAKGSAVARVPASLAEVKPVGLEPIAKPRGNPVGTVTGEAFDPKGWVESLKKSGLPENAPAPTYALDPKTAAVLKFPGQKQVVQLAMSALEQGDGFVIATPPGTGKTYTGAAIIRETLARDPDAMILHITKNRTLREKTQRVAENSYGVKMSLDAPEAGATKGVYSASYAGIMRPNSPYGDMKWDLVVADESGEARNWYQESTKNKGKINQGMKLKSIVENSKKAVYMSATPFHSPMEYGYLDKLGLWPKGGFNDWIAQNFRHRRLENGRIIGELDPGMQAKLRQQLIERGQMISQAISYDGYTAHFGVVPISDEMRFGLKGIHEGFQRAKNELLKMGKKGAAEKSAALEAIYTKNFLERERLPQAIEIAKQARGKGWQVTIFSEHSSEDLFRRERNSDTDPSIYQEIDAELGGRLSQIIPPFEDVYQRLSAEFGDQIGDYSGRGNSMGERNKSINEFLAGKTPMLYSTYAAGGIGVDMHDADYPEMNIKGGDKPRVNIFLGPPYSGVLLEQAMGRGWRNGVKSDTVAVFLGSDAPHDVRLFQEKIGPRMRSLRAAVLGENDSLASAMDAYSSEEKVRARQDALAYFEGDEVKVNAGSYQVRSSKRDVGINSWDQINFPHADTAKTTETQKRGMKYGEEVTGGDWSTLYQSLPSGGMEPPPSREEEVGKSTIDAIANSIVSGQGLPPNVSVQNLDPAERDAVVGAASAIAAGEVKLRPEADGEAVARQSMQSSLNIPRDMVLTYETGRTWYGKKTKKAVWKYPEGMKLTTRDVPLNPEEDKHTRHTGWGSQTGGIEWIARQAKVPEVGKELTFMIGSYQADVDQISPQLKLMAMDIFAQQNLNYGDEEVVSKVKQATEGKQVYSDPAIMKAAADMSTLFEIVHDYVTEAGVKIRDGSGNWKTWSEAVPKNPKYWPHILDFDAKVTHPVTGEKHTLKEIMGKRFPRDKYAEYIQHIAATSKESVADIETRLRGSQKKATPVQSNLQEMRTIDFPIVRQDFGVLERYFDEVARAIATEKNFGSDRGKLNKVISKIPSSNGRKDIGIMFDSLLLRQDHSGGFNRFTNAMAGFQAITKLPLSFVKVPFHAKNIPYGFHTGGITPTIKGLAYTMLHHSEAHAEATYLGVLARQVDFSNVSDNAIGQGVAGWVFRVTGFNRYYNECRVIAGQSARIYMEQDALRLLRKGGRTAEETRRTLNENMLIGHHSIDEAIETGRWKPEDLQRAQVAFANETMFSNNPMQMPKWARMSTTTETGSADAFFHRALRSSYSLQMFRVKTRALLRKQLVDEVVLHGNLKPLMYGMVAEPLAGAAILSATAALGFGIQRSLEGWTGHDKEENRWDKFKAILDERHKGLAGKVELWMDFVSVGIANETFRNLGDMLLNIAADPKKADKASTYYGMRLLEDQIGPIFNSTIVQPIITGAKVVHIYSTNQKHPEERWEKAQRAVAREAVQEVPLVENEPHVKEYVFPPPPEKNPYKRHSKKAEWGKAMADQQ